MAHHQVGDLPEELLQGRQLKRRVRSVRELLLGDDAESKETRALRARVARASAPFAQTGLQTYRELVATAAVLPSGLPALDLLLPDGGLASGQLIEVCGYPAAGKSRLCHTVACNVALNLEKRVLYIQTKGDFSANTVLKIMRGRFQLESSSSKVETAMKRISVATVRSLECLVVQLPGLVAETRPRLVVLDSVASLAHPHLGGGQMRTLAKLQTAAALLKRLAAEQQVAFLVVNHLQQPTAEEKEPKAALGAAWHSVPHTRLLLSKGHPHGTATLLKDPTCSKKKTITIEF
ncbi:DNA repair protein RAD51 homolog 4-like isoform X1 [Neocloeon triangulifer]|uniref:DNA repair protein RAD51 homolog 4-like isoform X1 n=1 Tax=Neocloeon triangulifer TaxID=2078957 RepID=UPI00286EF336|nr:DNA repair protein RAD51 homolog 4-like isoform X1 [Neocloeon triangulifer]